MTWTGEKPPLRRAEWTVRPVGDAVAERLVIDYHYSAGASKTSTEIHGLLPAGAFFDQDAVGAALWMPPTRAVAASLCPENPNGVLALSRLVCAPSAPGNAASFLMARSMRLLDRIRWPVLVTYADAWRGHTGAIYLATGWRDDGLTKPKPVYQKDGRMVSVKAGPNTRTHAQMLEMGAELVGRFSKRRFVHEAHA
jgi:hypothetical protein